MNTNSRKVLIKFLIMVIITIAVWYIPSDFYRLLISKGRYHLETDTPIVLCSFFIPFLFDIIMISTFGLKFIMFDVRKCIQHTKINKSFIFGVGICSFIIIGSIWGIIYINALIDCITHITSFDPDHIANIKAIKQAKMELVNDNNMTELANHIFGPLFFLSLIYALISGCREHD